MTYLAGFIIIGAKGLFVLIRWVTESSISYWPTARENLAPPPTIEVSCGRIWQVFLTLSRHDCHMTHSAPHSCAYSNCLFHYYVSHIRVIAQEDDIIA
jgi:hypothetical protein